MSDSNPLVQDRMRKTPDLRALGVDPYPVAAFPPTHSLPQVVWAERLISNPEPIRTANRVIARRDKDRANFMDLLDEGQKLQVYFRSSNLDQQTWRTLELIDLGDFIGVCGTVFRARAGGLTVAGREMKVLCRPLPWLVGNRVNRVSLRFAPVLSFTIAHHRIFSV